MMILILVDEISWSWLKQWLHKKKWWLEVMVTVHEKETTNAEVHTLHD